MGCLEGMSASFAFLIFSIFSISCIPFSSARDTLKPGQSVLHWETLISSGQIFELGFFNTTNLGPRFLGIWHTNDTFRSVVWIANRDNPLSGGTPGSLWFSDDGNLTITDFSESSTPLYSGSAASNSTLKLLDSGNLVLREGNSDNQGRILWQSFDHPTNTLLPGMKLGVNLKTRHNLSLNSWLSDVVPTTGAFTLGVDPNGTNQLLNWERRELYWASGAWDGKIFANMPQIVWSDVYNFSFISNEEEHFFTYSIEDGSVMSVLVMGSMGEFQQWNWSESAHRWETAYFQPTRPCEGDKSDDWPMGCVVQKSELNCSSGDSFLSRRQAPLAPPPNELNDLSLGLTDCKVTCKSNCSCKAYTTAYSNGTGCSFWYGELTGYKSSDEKDIYFRSSRNQRDTDQILGKRSEKWIKFIVPLATALVMIPICIYYIRRRKQKQRGKMRSEQQLRFEANTNREAFIEFNNANNPNQDGRQVPELPIFSFGIVLAATDNFSIANKLGQGGFGPVYKGQLLEGQEIAVKRLSKNSRQGLVEFKNELILIAKVQHLNLVRLIGCCIEAGERIIIYEYMPNGSLDSFLFDHVKAAQLDWGMRVHIIEGIAQGLLYLHRYSRLKVIHRDLKASNILLDKSMNPKISDFGLARIFEHDTFEANTERPAGTYGYMAPEYAFQGLFSVKSDVFSFGVLLLEIVSGKRCTSFYHFSNSMNLLGYAWELWKDDRGSELIDPLLGESTPKGEVLRYINVALLCVQVSARDRPSMKNIVSMFHDEGITLPSPKMPAFSTSMSLSNKTSSTSEPIPCSINDVTISKLDGR